MDAEQFTPTEQPPNYRVPTASTVDDKKKALVKAMLDCGNTVSYIAEVLRMSPNTITVIRDSVLPVNIDVEAIRKRLAPKFLDTADRAQDRITNSKLEAMSAYQLTGIASMNAEKGMLLLGQATQSIDIPALAAIAEQLKAANERLATNESMLVKAREVARSLPSE